jgi:hypothetical protein
VKRVKYPKKDVNLSIYSPKGEELAKKGLFFLNLSGKE